MDECSDRHDVCLFALDETGIRLESIGFYRWLPKRLPLDAEANGDHKRGVKSQHVGRFVDKLMRTDRGGEVCVILDSHGPSRSIASEYDSEYQGRLHFMFMPPYSPKLNPEENIWAWPRDCCTRDSAYAADKELLQRIRKMFHVRLQHTVQGEESVDARSYFKTA